MRSIDRYKNHIEEIGRTLMIFGDIDNFKSILAQRWSADGIFKAQADIMNYANTAADQIKNEIIGDGNEAKFTGRLKTAFFELNSKPSFAPSYFPVFDEALFEVPNNDDPNRNKQLFNALTEIYGNEATSVMLSLHQILVWSNYIVEQVSKMFDEVCKFVGYTPDPQEQLEPQQKDLDYYCKKAIEKGYLRKTETGYKRTSEISKAQLAYFLGKFLKKGTFPDKEYNILFNESRLGKALSQLADNKNGDGKPKGYEIIDELLNM